MLLSRNANPMATQGPTPRPRDPFVPLGLELQRPLDYGMAERVLQ